MNKNIIDIFFDNLKNELESHEGMLALKSFGLNLAKNNLLLFERKVLFTTLWEFYRETPSGILALALRVSDYWRDVNPWEANAKSAYLLFASVDEFGLYEANCIRPTHHQLFKISAEHFGVGVKDFLSNNYVLNAGREIGSAAYEYYRNTLIAKSLGFHLASELTSYPEFQYLLTGFLENRESYLIKSEKDLALNHFYVHTLIEQEHYAKSEYIARIFCEQDQSMVDDVRNGAIAYMELYKNLFASLNEKIFSN